MIKTNLLLNNQNIMRNAFHHLIKDAFEDQITQKKTIGVFEEVRKNITVPVEIFGMTPTYIKAVQGVKDSIKAKQNLNKDFLENAKIKNQISYNLYPWMLGWFSGTFHAEVQVNRQRGPSFRGISKVWDANPRTGKYDVGKPYLAIGLIVSPNEFKKIERVFDAAFLIGFNCSDASVRCIERGITNLIPYPIRLSPLLSTIYLLFKSKFKTDNKRIDHFEIRSKNQSVLELLSPAIVGEVNMIMGCILWTCFAVFGVPKVVKDRIKDHLFLKHIFNY